MKYFFFKCFINNTSKGNLSLAIRVLLYNKDENVLNVVLI